MMTNKPVSLLQLSNLVEEPELSEIFIRYSAGLPSTRQYNHYEINDIAELLNCLTLNVNNCDGFIFGYVVPQLNKEFDLLKITDKCVLNIELKSQPKDKKSIAKQLIQNQHYLKLLNREIHCFTFVSSNKTLYKLEDTKISEASFQELKDLCTTNNCDEVDLDKIFAPKNILVSPLNDTERFLEKDYLLTENQENIKKRIISKVNNLDSACFIGLTGKPGTGKTLLLYDIAFELAKNKKVLMIHSGILCEGHTKLEEGIKNLKISSAKSLRQKEINNVDYVLVDEAQRLYEGALDKIERWVVKAKTICIFSYDPDQRVSHSENDRKTVERINDLCGEHKEKLTEKIRTNEELALFINTLMDLNKNKSKTKFSHVKVFYQPSKDIVMETVNSLVKDGYHYISITPSFYDASLDYQKSDDNTHTVIGQEFDKVCMIMDSNFYYENGILKAKLHPNPDYIFTKLLYQGLTRARSDIAIVITDTELLKNIMVLFDCKE